MTLDIHKSYWWTTNAERRMHWAERSRRARTVRQIAAVHARKLTPAERFEATVTVCYPNASRRQDPANVAGTVAKAAIDGAVTDRGLLPDDDSEHLVAVTYRRGENTGRPGWYRLILTFDEVE